MDHIGHYDSPLGGITLAGRENMLTGLWFDGQKYFADTLSDEHIKKDLPVFDLTKKWLDIYFGGGVPDFIPQIKTDSTPFRRLIWDILLTIPYGKTMTYTEIAAIAAEKMGVMRMSAQAVGGAVGHNPISLIVPCHRVVGKNGSLTGYAAGTDIKMKLLEMESRMFAPDGAVQKYTR